MVKKVLMQTYLWVLLLLLYAPILIIVIYSFTDAKVKQKPHNGIVVRLKKYC